MELLDEIWRLIFAEHLDFVETVRLRRVSKRFKFLVDQLRPTELFVYGHRPQICRGRSFRDDRNSSNWIQLCGFHLKANSSFQIVFANLRVLELDILLGKAWKKGTPFNLELLNEFNRLEKLYLNMVIISRTQTLRLPNLRVFSLHLLSEQEYAEIRTRRQHPRLVLDSKVKRLFCPRITLLDINYPEFIESFMFLDIFESLTRSVEINRPNPTLFKSLRVVYVTFNKSVLFFCEELENLEEIHFVLIWDEERPLLNELGPRITALKRKNVKIYFLLDSLEAEIQNYHKLPERVRMASVDYGCLIRSLDNLGSNEIELNEWRLPVDFFKKFMNIQVVQVKSEVQDEKRFLWFLSNCTRLTELDFRREFLTQSLLDKLPGACRPLKVFRIGRRSPLSGLDLRPVYGLKQLFILEIDSKDASLDSPLDLMVLFESCRYLVDISLNYINVSKATSLYYVSTPSESELSKAHLTYLNKMAAFKRKDLKSNLKMIIEECKELRKRYSSHPIW